MNYNKLWLIYALILGLLQVLSLFIKVNILPYIVYPIMASAYFLLFLKPKGDVIIKRSYKYNNYLILYSLIICLSIIPFLILIDHSIKTYIVSVLAYFVPFALFRPFFNPDDFKEQVENFFKGLYISFTICLILILITGEYAINIYEGERYVSGELGASVISRIAIFVIFYSFLKIFKNPRLYIYIFPLLLSLFILILSGSKIGLASFILLMFLMLMFMFKKKRTYVILFLFICGLIPVILNKPANKKLKNLVDYVKKNEKGIESLNGRSIIWEDVWKIIGKSKAFGYGYGSPRVVLTKDYSSIIEKDPRLIERDIRQAHNAWLESLLNVGIIGTFFLLMLLLKTYKNIAYLIKDWKKKDWFIYLLVLFYLIYYTIRSVTEAAFAQASTIETIIFFSIVIIVRNYIAIQKFNKNELKNSPAE
jgi:O-antigen ligase